MIFCSSLKRVADTMPLFFSQGIDWVSSSDPDEIDWGIHEGKSYDLELVESYNKLIESLRNSDLDARIPGG